MSQLYSVYHALRQLEPDEGLEHLANVLFSMNEKMGDLHDLLVAQRMRGTLDYERDLIAVPPEFRVLARRLGEVFS